MLGNHPTFKGCSSLRLGKVAYQAKKSVTVGVAGNGYSYRDRLRRPALI
ncbi:hypothetical protein [Photorhabdus africana]|nr:hypothetical protein [Photorhabdus sp. CRI-LC]